MRPIQQLNRSVPIPVAQVLMQALAINADQRPASATHMRQALRHARQPNLALAATPIAPHPQPATRGWLLPATFISTLLLLLVALLLVVTRNPPPSVSESPVATVVQPSPIAEGEDEEEDTATKIVAAAATATAIQSTTTTEPTQPAVGTQVVAVAATRAATSTPTPTPTAALAVDTGVVGVAATRAATSTPTPTFTPTPTPTPTQTPTLGPTPTPTLTPTLLPKIVEYRASGDTVLFESMVGWGGEGGQTCYFLQTPLPSNAGRLQYPYPNATIPVSQPQVEERDGNIYVTFEANSTEAQPCGARLYDARVELDSGVWVIKNAKLISGPYSLDSDPNVAQGGWFIDVQWR